MTRWWTRKFAGALLVGLTAATLGTGGAALAQTQTPSISSNEIYEMAKLATVMVVEHFQGQVTVPESRLAPDRLKAAEAQVLDMVRANQIPNTKAAITRALVEIILRDPLTYIVPGSGVHAVTVQMVSQGSGFFVTPDGYIVTNAHVVAPDPAEIKQGLVGTALKTFVHDLAQQKLPQLAELLGGAVPPEVAQEFVQAESQYVLRYMRLSSLDKQTYVELGAAIPGVTVGQHGLTADVVARGDPVPGKDVAILKVEGRQFLPVLSLGDDAQLKVSDPLFVVGYPGDATFLPILSSQSQVQPSLTAGILSRRAEMQAGWTALQTDATVHPGNSGGPVLDKDGQVIGIATFAVMTSSGTQSSGQNFVVPTTLIREFLQRANVTPQSSKTSDLYRQALADYDRQRYRDSLGLFQQVNALFPGSPYVQSFLSSAQAQILAGKDRSGSGFTGLAEKGGAAVVIAAALVAAGTQVFRRRRRAGPPAGAGGPAIPRAAPAVPPAGTSAKVCARCGAAITPGERFCGSCGAEAAPEPRACVKCGTAAEPGQKFCKHCGAAL